MTLFTLTDLILLALVLASAGLALRRGLMREGLAMATWLLAAGLTYAVYRAAGPELRDLLGPSWLVHGLILLALFCGLVVMFRGATRDLVHRKIGGEVASWDQVAGFFFGVARGVVAIALLFQAYVAVFTYDNVPSWFQSARLYPVVTLTSNSLNAVAEEPIRGTAARFGTHPDRADRQPSARAQDGPPDGYSTDERGAIDQLVRTRLDTP